MGEDAEIVRSLMISLICGSIFTLAVQIYLCTSGQREIYIFIHLNYQAEAIIHLKQLST